MNLGRVSFLIYFLVALFYSNTIYAQQDLTPIIQPCLDKLATQITPSDLNVDTGIEAYCQVVCVKNEFVNKETKLQIFGYEVCVMEIAGMFQLGTKEHLEVKLIEISAKKAKVIISTGFTDAHVFEYHLKFDGQQWVIK